MQYAFQLNKPHKKKKPGKQKTVGQKVDLLFFYPTKDYLQFLYVTAIKGLQSVSSPAAVKNSCGVTPRYSQMRGNSCIEGIALPVEILRI